ncbi:hypothetical protein PQJ75_25565 [Rhodoplanes sp. TEM]|nr:hypothetical protein [Rhodoplanes tepidamans]MDC7987114.1 hypothetical protein [Rhodoplanes sp. TEM]MDQ0357509.1 transposase [Rhodoplanes tepidamans]
MARRAARRGGTAAAVAPAILRVHRSHLSEAQALLGAWSGAMSDCRDALGAVEARLAAIEAEIGAVKAGAVAALGRLPGNDREPR